MTFTTRRLALALSLALLGGGAACDRTYLTPSHGRSYRQAFAVQTVNPGRQTDATAVHGLDSQEAAIVAQTYRHNLAPKDQAAAMSSSAGAPLMYAPSAAAPRDNNMPPPSVPADQH
jgi:hypothetical protein